MKHIFNRTRACLLCLTILIFTHNAFAANILIASTTEINTTVVSQFIPNLYTQFNLGGHTVTTAPDSLGSAATAAQPNFGGYDLVVIMGVYDGLTTANEAAVTAAINAKTSQAFVLFSDGTSGDGSQTPPGSNSHNIDSLVNILTANNNGFAPVAGIYTSNGLEDFSLNAASPFAASFAGIDPFQAGAYVPFASGVPANNTLYVDNNNDAYGVFVPQSQSNGGFGACVFAVPDASQFADTYQAGNPNFGAIIIAATTTAGGACLPALAPISIPTLSEWMVMVLALLLLLLGVIYSRKNHQFKV